MKATIVISIARYAERARRSRTSERGTSTDGIRQDDRRQTVNAVGQVDSETVTACHSWQ